MDVEFPCVFCNFLLISCTFNNHNMCSVKKQLWMTQWFWETILTSICTSHNSFVYVKLHYQHFRQNMLIESKLDCRLGMLNTSMMQILSSFIFVSTSMASAIHSNGFGNIIITQAHIAWKYYFVGVEFRPLQSHMQCGCLMHNPFANAPQMRCIALWKEIVLYFYIFGITSFINVHHVAKLRNVARFVFSKLCL